MSNEPRLIRDEDVREGTALCLSGGGYRAMVFHLGVLWRLNEAGGLASLDRVSSVSGGSITAGVLARAWPDLGFDEHGVAAAFREQVVAPVLRMAGESIDVSSVLVGVGLPGISVAGRVAAAYRKHLFGDLLLKDLDTKPRFVFNATNLESGALMRFSRPYVADYRVGMVRDPEVPLADAVAASSAFPPFLSPFSLQIDEDEWETVEGNDLTTRGFRREIHLTDGGVYDNLGLQTAQDYRTLLVSDAGGRLGADSDPPEDWLRHVVRVLQVMDNQVRALRKQDLVDAFQRGERRGMYISVRSDLADFHLADPIPVDPAVVRRLAGTPTRLDGMESRLQHELVNWGYAAADTGLRKWVDPTQPRGSLPYPDAPLA